MTPEDLFGNAHTLEIVATTREPTVWDLELCGETVRVTAGEHQGRRGVLASPTTLAWTLWFGWVVLSGSDELMVPAHYLEYCA